MCQIDYTSTDRFRQIAELLMASDNDTITLQDGTVVIVSEFHQKHFMYKTVEYIASQMTYFNDEAFTTLKSFEKSLNSI